MIEDETIKASIGRLRQQHPEVFAQMTLEQVFLEHGDKEDVFRIRSILEDIQLLVDKVRKAGKEKQQEKKQKTQHTGKPIPIHTILTIDTEGKEYRVPFLHRDDDPDYIGFLCDGCSGIFTEPIPTAFWEGKVIHVAYPKPKFLGYYRDDRMGQLRKVEYCERCADERARPK